MPDDLHAAGLYHAVGLRALDIAAALDGEIDDDRTRPHRRDHLFGDQARCRAAGDQCSRDDNVLFLNVLGHQRRLLGLILLGHFLRVSARGLRVLELFILDRKKLRAENSRLAPSLRDEHRSP